MPVAPAEGGLRRLGTEDAGRQSISGWAKKVMGFPLRSQPEARGFTLTRAQGGVVVRVTQAVKTQAEARLVCSVRTVNCVSAKITLLYKCASRDSEKELWKW